MSARPTERKAVSASSGGNPGAEAGPFRPATSIAVANGFGRPAVRIARVTSATVATAPCQERCTPKSTASRMPT